MEKRITYPELLGMIKNGTQPESVKCLGLEFFFAYGNYKFRGLRLEAKLAARYSSIDIATVYCITYEESVLDEAEKRYLRAVIRPFRDRINHIVKEHMCGNTYIRIDIKPIPEATANVDSIDLPYFKEGTMYTGMVTNKDYTLEELGL